MTDAVTVPVLIDNVLPMILDLLHIDLSIPVVHLIPKPIINADKTGIWSSGRRLKGSLLSSVAPFLADMHFELLTLGQISGEKTSDVAELTTLVRFAGKPGLSLMFQLYSATNNHGPNDLPWLDVERALVIGGGADYGDDTCLVLDYRLDPSEPRVVINQFKHYGREGARTKPSHVTWLQIANDAQALLTMLEKS